VDFALPYTSMNSSTISPITVAPVSLVAMKSVGVARKSLGSLDLLLLLKRADFGSFRGDCCFYGQHSAALVRIRKGILCISVISDPFLVSLTMVGSQECPRDASE